jgi:ribonucleoside-diphosphate reductase alpha chain
MAAAQPFISGAISKTVNMPEMATVEDVEELLVQSWKLGLKAVAIYRDNCKVAQPLSADKRTADVVAAPATLAPPVRKRLPHSRPSRTTSFQVGDAEGYITAGEYPDDGIGEIFLKVAKQGSTLSGVMDAFAIAVSIALQYGVPLETYVEKFINTRFEPSGMTNDPDIRFASSLVDYVFRRLALDYLTPEQRASLGIKTIEERKAVVAGYPGDAPDAIQSTAGDLAARSDAAQDAGSDDADPSHRAEGVTTPEPSKRSGSAMASDAPLCYSCGSKMQPAGSCYVCSSCGSTSGCS